nr:hypothetical transcript [Hymenolepis microstoma]
MEPSLYFSLLPSEVCRLVLGFLMDSGFSQTANVFLQECCYLSELREVLHRTPNASFRLPGFTFDDLLKDYTDVVNSLNEKRDKATIGFGPSEIPICRPGGAIASLRHFLFEFKNSWKNASTQCDNLPKPIPSVSPAAPKILFPLNQHGSHIFIRHSTPHAANSTRLVTFQSANVSNLSINKTQTVPRDPHLPIIESASAVTTVSNTTQVSGTSESRQTVCAMDTTKFGNTAPKNSGSEASYGDSLSANNLTQNLLEHRTPEYQLHNDDPSQKVVTIPRSHDLQTLSFAISPACSDDALNLEGAKTPELQIQPTVAQDGSNFSSTGSSRRKPLRVLKASRTASTSSQLNCVLDAERVLFSVAAHAETLAYKINSCLAPKEETLVFNGLNEEDYDEILNIMEEDFNVAKDTDLTDILDNFDPFLIDDPNFPLPALPPPDASNSVVTSEPSVENHENAPQGLMAKSPTLVRKPKCVRKKSIPRKRITSTLEDSFEFPNNGSDNPLKGSGSLELVPSTSHADPTGSTQAYTENPPTVTEFVDLDKTPVKMLPMKFSTNPEPNSSVQAKLSTIQTPRTMEIASALVSLSQTQSGSSKGQILKLKKIASKPTSMLRDEFKQTQPGSLEVNNVQRREVASKTASVHLNELPQEEVGSPGSRVSQRKDVPSKPLFSLQKDMPSTSRQRRGASRRIASAGNKSKANVWSSQPTTTQCSSYDKIPTKPIKRNSESKHRSSNKRQKLVDGKQFVPETACALKTHVAGNLSTCQISENTSTFSPEPREDAEPAIDSQYFHVGTGPIDKKDSSHRLTAASESLENPPSFGSFATTNSEVATSNLSSVEMVEYSIPIQVLYPVSDATCEKFQPSQPASMFTLNTTTQVVESDASFQIIDLNNPELGHFPTESSSAGSPNLSKSRLLQHIKTMKQDVGDSISSSLQSQTACGSNVHAGVPVAPVQQFGGTPMQSPRLIIRVPKDMVKGCSEMTPQELLVWALQQQLAIPPSTQRQREQAVSTESTQVLQEQQNSSAAAPIRQIASSQILSSVKENLFPSPKSENKSVDTMNVDLDIIQKTVRNQSQKK